MAFGARFRAPMKVARPLAESAAYSANILTICIFTYSPVGNGRPPPGPPVFPAPAPAIAPTTAASLPPSTILGWVYEWYICQLVSLPDAAWFIPTLLSSSFQAWNCFTPYSTFCLIAFETPRPVFSRHYFADPPMLGASLLSFPFFFQLPFPWSFIGLFWWKCPFFASYSMTNCVSFCEDFACIIVRNKFCDRDIVVVYLFKSWFGNVRRLRL